VCQVEQVVLGQLLSSWGLVRELQALRNLYLLASPAAQVGQKSTVWHVGRVCGTLWQHKAGAAQGSQYRNVQDVYKWCRSDAFLMLRIAKGTCQALKGTNVLAQLCFLIEHAFRPTLCRGCRPGQPS
jgi:hypothetical protein